MFNSRVNTAYLSTMCMLTVSRNYSWRDLATSLLNPILQDFVASVSPKDIALHFLNRYLE